MLSCLDARDVDDPETRRDAVADSTLAYRLGVVHDSMPAPLITEHCREVPAGPLRFVVESRYLPSDMAELKFTGDGNTEPLPQALDDGGGTVHVFAVADGLEHLRFDCFETYPHYHYIRNRERENLIVRLDDIAFDDPIAFTVDRLRTRLPEMLEFAGAAEAAEAVRAEPEPVAAAIDSLEQLLGDARDLQLERRQTQAQAGL
jgi:hypothetical protein